MTFLDSLVADRSQVTSGLPDNFDGNGVTITIDCIHGENGTGYAADWFMSDDITANQMNNTLYYRKDYVESTFDVKLSFTYTQGENYINDRVQVIQAGLGDLDIIGVAPWAVELPLEGVCLDLKRLPYLDFSRAWWLSDTNESFTLDDSLMIAFGCATATSLFSGTCVTFFNRDLADNLGVEDLYEVARSGGWTYEYVMGLMKDYYIDVDGDPERSTYAYCASPSNQFWNMGGRFVTIDSATKEPVFDTSSDMHQDIFDKIRDMFNYYGVEVDMKYAWSSQILAWEANLRLIEESGDQWDFNVGILPPLKYDENAKYIGAGYLVGSSITIDSYNPETSALVLEALAYYGWKECVPKYYETIIKYKYSSDPQNAEMLDLMYANLFYDPVYMYCREVTRNAVDGYMTYSGEFPSYIKRKAANWNKTVKNNVKEFRNIMKRLYP